MRQVAHTLWTEVLPTSPVFTTEGLARRIGAATSNISRDLRELANKKLVTRVTPGVWAVTTHPDFSAYAVVPFLFSKARAGYVSLLSALNLHGMIDQIPATIQIITTSQRPILRTPVAVFEFHRLQPAVFGGFEKHRPSWSFDLAVPEKAIFDLLYLSVRRARRFTHLPEVELPETFSESSLLEWIARVRHAPLRRALESRWEKRREFWMRT